MDWKSLAIWASKLPPEASAPRKPAIDWSSDTVDQDTPGQALQNPCAQQIHELRWGQKKMRSRFLKERVLGELLFSLYRCQTPAQRWIKILHPWVQEFYPVFGLGSGRHPSPNLVRGARKTPVQKWQKKKTSRDVGTLVFPRSPTSPNDVQH